MTAEILIMNREAVALAADSAVTLGEGEKIFTSANKIFSLSRHKPIGIMVYGNANFMSVPWETIIKMYRKKYADIEFPTLKEYAFHFIEYLKDYVNIISEEEKARFFEANVGGYFERIKAIINKEIDKYLTEKEQIEVTEIKKIMTRILNREYQVWQKTELLPNATEEHIKRFEEKYKENIIKVKNIVFEKLPFSKSQTDKLVEIAISLALKAPEKLFHSGVSGIVIAGFGENEIYPAVQSFHIEGIVDDFLKYKEYNYDQIDYKHNASIMPFAQGEEVGTFIEGINPRYYRDLKIDYSQIFQKYSELSTDYVKKEIALYIDNTNKEASKKKFIKLQKNLKKISKGILDDYWKRMDDYRLEKFVFPLLTIVSMLPKNEIATVAESLVNLTSFRKRVSLELETVGGPIDVAVISKGDGFIWIKRKLYFEKDLNPRYLHNYNMGDIK